MSEGLHLVVNADDLGMNEAVDQGIFAAHAEGVVTSASLMVLQGAAPAAAASLGTSPGLAVGLHLDLGGWDYVEGAPIPGRLDPGDPIAVERELRAQIERFRDLVGTDPTHLDSHKHVHDAKPAAGAARLLAAELGVPLRGVTIRYEGGFYGQDESGGARPKAIEPGALVRLIENLPLGWTEIGCHPAAGAVPSSYDGERRIELDTLCDPTVREAIVAGGVGLCSFADLPRRGTTGRP